MTLTELRTLKAQILAAISNVLKNQSYTIAETTYTYANLATLRQWLKDVDKDIERASSTRQGMRIRRVIPRSD
jgi:hypothetical protein